MATACTGRGLHVGMAPTRAIAAIRRTLRAMSLFVATGMPVIAGPTIGVVSKGPGIVWEQTAAGYREAAAAAGATVLIKVPPATTAASAQIKLLETLANQKLDALVIAPIDPVRLAVPIKALADRGVKIVTLDTPLPPGLAQVHVSHDQKAMAEAAAEIVAGMAADTDEIAILRWLRSDRAVTEREENLIHKLAELKPGAKILADVHASTGDNGTVSNARTLLQKHRAAKLVVSTSFGGTKDMVKLIRERNLTGKILLVGFGIDLPKDIAPAIEQGLLHAWIAQRPKQLGQLSVKAAAMLAQGEPVPPALHTNFLVVTRANLNSTEVEALKKESEVAPAETNDGAQGADRLP